MLSIVINVKNGEKHIARCLNSLSKFDDVVILDNYSTDRTIEIIKQYPNVRLFQHEFCGMGKLRNIAAGYAQNDWIFFVDSDEIINPELANTLLNMQFEQNCVYKIFRKNFYDNYLISTSSWENDWVFRLYNRNQTKYTQTDVHESIELKEMKEKKISNGFLYHFPYDNVATLIDKMQFYSTLYAKQNFGKKKPKLYSLPLRAMMMFFKCYILKRGFTQGYEGLVISAYNAMGVFSKYIKLYELGYKRKIALAITIDNNLDQLVQLTNKINQQALLPEYVLILINDKLAINGTNIIKQLVKNNLIVPAEINIINNDVANAINNHLTTKDGLTLVYIENNNRLNNPQLLKKCKTSILKSKPFKGITFFNSPH